MVGKNPSDCTICHKPTELPPPQYPHPPESIKSCRACHQSAEIGALPMTHALYTDGMCLLCHNIKTGGSAPGSSGSPSVSPHYTLEPSQSPGSGG
jgi:hypothetical protein